LKALNRRRFGRFALIGIFGIVLVFLTMFAVNVLAELVFAPLLELVFRVFTNINR
jgi:hypothetical protein